MPFALPNRRLTPSNGIEREGAVANPSEESIARVVECLFNHPRHRELLYKALVHCQTERTEHAAEEFLARQPEAAQALQTPYTLLRNLAAAGGVTVIAHDAQGLALDETRCEQLRAEGLDDDALADLVAERRVLTTPAGCAACELLAPEHRTLAAIYKVPERRATFVRLLDFCRTPRKLADINQLLADDPALAPSQRTAGQKLHACYFIDRLEEAGGLVWDGSWVTTDAGKRALASV